MITEDYVSFETAKLLKEKGFNERLCHWYDDEEYLHKNTGLYLCNSAELDGRITAPTLQMTMKWLREVHRIIIAINYANICGLGYKYIAGVIKTKENGEIEESDTLLDRCVYNVSYEQACEVAIKYCLENLI